MDIDNEDSSLQALQFQTEHVGCVGGILQDTVPEALDIRRSRRFLREWLHMLGHDGKLKALLI